MKRRMVNPSAARAAIATSHTTASTVCVAVHIVAETGGTAPGLKTTGSR